MLFNKGRIADLTGLTPSVEDIQEMLSTLTDRTAPVVAVMRHPEDESRVIGIPIHALFVSDQFVILNLDPSITAEVLANQLQAWILPTSITP